MPGTQHPRRAERLLVVGSIAFDRLVREGRVEHRLGGVAAYGGLTAARLGLSVDAWTALSPEGMATAKARLAPLALFGTASPTCTHFVNEESPHAERRQRCPERATTLVAASAALPDTATWEWIHLGPLHPDDVDRSIAESLRPRCRLLSLDLQGYTRSIADDGRVGLAAAPSLAARLEGIDWVKASEAEWQLATAALRMDAAGAIRHFGWRGLLVSAGERGGVLHTEHEAIPWQAEPVPRVALETGAGDVFTAAFLVHRIAHGELSGTSGNRESFGHALRFAAAIAARHVAGEWLDLRALALD